VVASICVRLETLVAICRAALSSCSRMALLLLCGASEAAISWRTSIMRACVRQVLGIGTESMLSCKRTSNRAREIDLTRWVGHGGASSTEQIGCRRLHAVVVLELLDDVAHTIDGFLACSLLGPPCVRDWVTGCLSNWRTHVPARWLASVGRASDRQLRVRRLLRPFGGSIVHWSSSARCTMPRRLYAMHHNESIVSRPNECTSLRA